MVADPEQIRTVAARLRGDADRVRRLAGRVVGAGEVVWRSPAASLFRARLGERAHGLRRCAVDLETAAHLVEVHAEGVNAARSELARARAIATELGARVAGGR
jgi:hypothetical protein